MHPEGCVVQAAKTTLFAAVGEANVCKSAAGDFCQWTNAPTHSN